MSHDDDPLPPDLAALLADLPIEREPERDLWSGVAEQIRPVPLPAVRPRPWRLAAGLALAAAVLLAALTAGRPAPVPPTVGEPRVALERWEVEVRETTTELQAVLDDRRDGMDPQALEVIERALSDIDAAIADMHRALADDPDDDALAVALADVWQRKVEVLRTAAELGEAG